MELKRDIYQELLSWKEINSGKVLKLDGARKVGKTHILQKFAKEYRHCVYINMTATSGRDFLYSLNIAMKWVPGETRPEKPIHKALSIFDKEFVDDKDNLVIIDEVQESSEVYNLIRHFSRDFAAHFVVAGSYLGKTLKKEFYLSAGDTDYLKMEPLSFPEFLDVFEKREIYEQIDLFGRSDHTEYDDLKKYFEIYLQIGGYPEAVLTYVKTGDITESFKMNRKLIDVFERESQKYFDAELKNDIFEILFSLIAENILSEKNGFKDLFIDLVEGALDKENGRITEQMLNSAISWLHLSHQIGSANKSIDCNYLDQVFNCRYYFLDCGIANIFFSKTASQEKAHDCLCENFVYLELLKRIYKCEVAGDVPWLGTDEENGEEVCFYVRSRLDYKNYGLEVICGNKSANTAEHMMFKGKLDYVYHLENTYGGINGSMYNVPLYLIGRISFNVGIDEQ